MFYVYILRSLKNPEKVYVGYTTDIDQRLTAHNEGKSLYTAKYSPWSLHSYVALQDEAKAIELEKYLKSGAGKAFTKKHLL